jgi:hypothetical protein
MDGVRRAGHVRREKRLVRQKILALVVRRGISGVSKGDLLTNFGTSDHNDLMQEVDNLVPIGTVVRDEIGPNSFRLRATPQGQDIAASTLWEDLIVDEPT